jgi:hypothetical protein
MEASTRNIVAEEIDRHQSRLRPLVRCLLVRVSDLDDVSP